MLEVRFHGRGGHGVVSAAELLAAAAFHDGRCAQAFPMFGSERTGAPVVSYCRISDDPIRSHDPVVAPGAVVIGDATLLADHGVVSGLEPEGFVVLNASALPEWLEAAVPAGHAAAVPATTIALLHLGRPLPHAALLGRLVALTRAVSVESLLRAFEDRFPPSVARANALCVTEVLASA